MNTPDRMRPESSAARCDSLGASNEPWIDALAPRDRSLLRFMWLRNLYDSSLKRDGLLNYKQRKMIYRIIRYQRPQLSRLIHPMQPRCRLHAYLAAVRRRWTLCAFSRSHAYSEWMPHGPFVVTIGIALSCSPCELGTDRRPNNVACMAELEPSEVFWRFDYARNSVLGMNCDAHLQLGEAT
jgi:hypothetical protein